MGGQQFSTVVGGRSRGARRLRRGGALALALVVAVGLAGVSAERSTQQAAAAPQASGMVVTEAPAPPTDALQTPARSTLSQADQLLVDTSSTVNNELNTSYRRLGMYKGKAADSGTADQDARPDLDADARTASGRIIDSTGARPLELRYEDTGGPSLLQLTSPEPGLRASGQYSESRVSEVVNGQTLVIGRSDAGPSGPFLTASQASSPNGQTPVTTRVGVGTSGPTQSPAQQWTAMYDDPRSITFRLVDRADGLCLSNGGPAQGAEQVVTEPCHSTNHELWEWNQHSSRLDAVGSTDGFVHSLDCHQWTGDGHGTCDTEYVHGGDDGGATLQLTRLTETTSQAPAQQVDPVPSWATTLPTTGGTANDQTGYSLATGDLDRVVGTDGQFHDESAVLVNQGNFLKLWVIDYNATPTHQLVTDSGTSLTALIPQGQNLWDAKVVIGDFDRAGRNRIAVVYQTGPFYDVAYRVQFLTYTGSGSKRTLALAGPPQSLAAGAMKAGSKFAWSLDVAVGDFDNSDQDSLALVSQNVGGCFLNVTTFSGSQQIDPENPVNPVDKDVLTVRHEAYQQLDNATSSAIGGGSAVGPRLVSGLFTYDGKGFGLNRRELMVSWRDSHGNRVYRLEELTTLADRPKQADVLDLNTLGEVSQPVTGPDDLQSPAMVAGGFQGVAPSGDIRLWGVALVEPNRANARATSTIGVITPTYPDGQDGAATLQVKDLATGSASGRVGSLSAYDAANDSLRLGTPAVVDVTHLENVLAVAAQPPDHADWSAEKQAFVNVSRDGTAKVTLGSSSTSTVTQEEVTKSTIGGHLSVSGEVGVSFNSEIPAVAKSKASVSLEANYKGSWGSDEGGLTAHKTSVENTYTTSAFDDDIVSAVVDSLRLFRYPVLGSERSIACPAGAGATTCYQYVDITVPTGRPIVWTGLGKDIADYQPSWENGNALSYPDLADGRVPIADAATPDRTNVTSSDGPILGLFNSTVGAAVTKSAIALGTSDDKKTTTTTTHTEAVDATVKTSYSLEPKNGPGLEANYSVGGGIDYAKDHDTSDQTTTDTETSFEVELPSVSEKNNYYQVGGAFYYASSGAAHVRFGVGFTKNESFWQSTYGTLPDLAFSEPFAYDLVNDGSGANPDYHPYWNPYPNRQQIRGFSVLQAPGGTGENVGVPFAQNPLAGQPVQFEVMLHNYSLVEAPVSKVEFYAVPTNGSGEGSTQFGPDQGSKIIDLGGVATTKIPARGMSPVLSPVWRAPAGGAGTNTSYRIFAVAADAAGGEVHPLIDQDGPCPEKSIEETSSDKELKIDGELTDPLTGEKETLACGQNNQGWGAVTVTTQAPTAAHGSATQPQTHTTGAGFETGNTLRAAPGSGVDATLVAGQSYPGSLSAKSTVATPEHRTVLVYDGPPKNGHLIAQTSLDGSDAHRANAAGFNWQPTTPGRHVVYEELMPNGPDEKLDVRKVVVDVVAPTGAKPGSTSGSPSSTSSSSSAPSSASSSAPTSASTGAGTHSGTGGEQGSIGNGSGSGGQPAAGPHGLLAATGAPPWLAALVICGVLGVAGGAVILLLARRRRRLRPSTGPGPE